MVSVIETTVALTYYIISFANSTLQYSQLPLLIRSYIPGQYQINIITPAVNGIVVPAIALLFATLVSNTINTLRQRQLDVRTALNMEACEMRTLQSVVDSFPKRITVQSNLREYLIQYASRLIAESKPGVNIIDLEFSGSIDSELNGFLGKLNEINIMSFSVTSTNGASGDAAALPPSLLSECYAAITRLKAPRGFQHFNQRFRVCIMLYYHCWPPHCV